MTEISYWWTTTGAPAGHQVAEYTQAHLDAIASILAGASDQDGVIPNWPDGNLAGTSPSVNTVNIGPGAAVVDGRPYINDATEPVNIPSASGGGNTRIDRIVLRADWASFTVTIHRIAGTDAASPTAPALTQNDGVTWDLPLYQALVDTSGNVTLTNEKDWAAPLVDDSSVEVDQATGQLQVKEGGVTNAMIRNAAAVSVLGRSANSSGDVADIAAGANDRLLARVSNALSFVQLTLGMIPSALITEVKLAAAVVAQLVTNGDSHNHSGGDGAQIPTTGIQDSAIDDSKVGNRVLQFYRRRGGNATDWDTPGTTVYTPGEVRSMGGSHNLGVVNAGATATASISFPLTFSGGTPFVIGTVASNSGEPFPFSFRIYSITDTGFSVVVKNETTASDSINTQFHWLAIGPE